MINKKDFAEDIDPKSANEKNAQLSSANGGVLDLAFGLSRDCMAICDSSGNILRTNPALASLAGKNQPGELTGINIYSLIFPEKIIPEIKTTLAQSRIYECEAMLGADNPKEVELRAAASPDSANLVFTFADVGESRRRERDVVENQATINSFYENAPLMMGVVEFTDDDVLFISANRTTAEFYDVDGDLAGRRASEFTIARKYIEIWRENFRLSQESGTPAKFVYERLIDGRMHWLSVTLAPIGGLGSNRCSFILEDITERINTEIELTESKDRLQSLLDASPDIVCFKDGEGRWLEANSADLELFGIADVDYFGKKDSELAGYSPFYREAFLTCEDSDEETWLRESITRVQEIIPRPDGTERIFDVIKVPLFNPDGSRRGLVVIGRDVTEQRSAEEALRASELQYRNIFRNAPIGICTFSRDGSVLEANEELVRILGSPSLEATKSINILKLPMMIESGIAADVIECFDSGDRQSAVRYYTSRWGKTIFLRYILAPIIHDHGEVAQVQALVEDFTDRKNAENALIQSEQKYRNLFETMAQGVFYQSSDGYITTANRAALEMLGVTTDEIKRHSVFSTHWKTIGESGKVIVPQEYPSILAIRNRREYKNIVIGVFNRNDKAFRWISFSAKPHINDQNGEVTESFVTMHDITARKQAEIELRKSQERFHLLIEQAPDAIFLHDLNGRIVEFNHKAVMSTGYSAEELKTMHVADIETQLAPGRMLELWTEMAEKHSSLQIEGFHRRKDGEMVPVDVSLGPIEIQGRKLILVFARDISDRKESETALRESEEKYRKLVDTALAGFYIIQDDKFIFCNSTFAEIFGYEHHEIIGKKVLDIIAPESKAKVHEELRQRVAGIKEYSRYEFHGLRKSGEIIDCEVFGRRILFNGQPAVQGITIDITEKNKSRHELQKIARLESLGVLAGGIAHNFKNMLTSMSLSVELARLKPAKTKEYLEKVTKSIEQATALANRFQTFSRGGDPIKEVIDINEIIREAVSLSTSGSSLSTDLQLSNDISPVAADPRQMNEVFTNLIINARHAMPSGGPLRISSSELTGNDASIAAEENCKMVRITVEDEGAGIPKDIINNIFDPFFTTKKEGHGLGLASVHYIIQKHHGSISVDSEPGRGTRFEILLPAVAKSLIEATRSLGKDEFFPKPLKVLLMDDNEDILENLIDFGNEFNLYITGARNPGECVAKFRDAYVRSEPFDVVILDLTIEGSKTSGAETLKKLNEIDENVRALVFSGHSSQPVVSNYEEYGFAGRLEKPVNIDNFCREIKRVVDL